MLHAPMAGLQFPCHWVFIAGLQLSIQKWNPFMIFLLNFCRTHCSFFLTLFNVRLEERHHRPLLLVYCICRQRWSRPNSPCSGTRQFALPAALQHAVHSIRRKLYWCIREKTKGSRCCAVKRRTDDAWQPVRVYSYLTCCQRHCQNPERRSTMKAASTGPHHHRAESSLQTPKLLQVPAHCLHFRFLCVCYLCFRGCTRLRFLD